jgi:laminin B (domain IV)
MAIPGAPNFGGADVNVGPYLLLLVIAIAGCNAAGQSPVLVSHDFNQSAQGWQVARDTGTVVATFTASGGYPGGCITGTDEAIGETWYFRAPESVLKQLPAAVSGTISFSLKQSESQAGIIGDDVVILGPAGRLSYRFPTSPGTDWTGFSVRLSDSEGWTWNWNRRATQAQINSVLAAPTNLDIRGEYVTGEDEGSLDNFVLKGPAR